MDLPPNTILDTDSYKASHFKQYPPGATSMFSYLESRGGHYGSTVFFGLQYLLERYLTGRITVDMVQDAAAFFAAHGEPFNEAGWMRIATTLEGRLPVRIRSVPEGTVVPTKNILMSVESTDPETFWIVSWLETQFVRLWYPITVATRSWHIKRMLLGYLAESADDPLGEIGFKLHDFGGRGASTRESAGVGGMAHLVNFFGSDTIEGVRFANHYYGEPMAGFSIPAAEHSTITMWGKKGELDAYRNMVRQFCKPGATVACVSDSYDLWGAVEHVWGDELRDEIAASGATLVIRPDSGDPAEVVLRLLQVLERKVGCRRNSKGYKLLPKYFRIIQGDGVDEDSIEQVLHAVTSHGFSASNVGFGMGGGLLQKLDRDTQRFAFKCSEATVDGETVRVFKDPVTDHGKASKAGRLDLVHVDGRWQTVEGTRLDSELRLVFENGEIKSRTTLAEVRARAQGALS